LWRRLRPKLGCGAKERRKKEEVTMEEPEFNNFVFNIFPHVAVYFMTHSLTQCCRIFFEMLIVTQLVK
jgi:hypothetical protein